jgi:DNA-binding IclR family transcriptional regulator
MAGRVRIMYEDVDQFYNKSLNRALRIIELLAHNKGPMKLQLIAEKTKIPESTVLRILNTLITNKYAQQDSDTKKYFLSLKFSYIGNLISSQLSIRDVVKPFLVELSEKSRESTCLAVEQDAMAVYIDYVDGPDSLLKTLHLIGRAAPLHCTGVGKSLLLNYSAEDLDRYIKKKGLEPLTEHSIKTKEQLVHEIEKVKSQGYAIDDEECEDGVRCVAAPVRDYMGKVIASISVTGPKSRLTMERVEVVKDYIVDITDRVSTNFRGY